MSYNTYKGKIVILTGGALYEENICYNTYKGKIVIGEDYEIFLNEWATIPIKERL